MLLIVRKEALLPSRVMDASPFSPRHLQSSSDSQYANMAFEGVGA